MNVGVRELKSHLSSYLERAAAGERIVVTDRGRPRALLVPLPGDDDYRRGVENGWITPPIDQDRPPAPARASAAVSIAAMMREDREE